MSEHFYQSQAEKDGDYVYGAAHERALLERFQHDVLQVGRRLSAQLKPLHNASRHISQRFAHQSSTQRLVRAVQSTHINRQLVIV